MTKMVTACIGVLLLALHFTSQAQAQNGTNYTTDAPMMTTTLWTNTTMMVTVGTGVNSTSASGASLSVQSNALSLLVPVVLAASFLYGRF